ncbi:extracellular calcium-sensing receptor-like [Orbicella faveolata]|uniref:extracellular calcium-sensing receptor-like n=1 Tax=Orbicella faveolata TaxID=48498 RepID=UPI0009E204BF|nr:extracellular calcium-sensing receptor-like [Orbicella faveolata]
MNSYKPLSRYHFVLFCLTILNGVVQGPYKDGDIILGGLLRVHLRGDSENQCGNLDVRGLNRVFAMIFAIEKINNDSNLLPNISLGYDIRDYCEIALKATRISYDLIKSKLLTNLTRGKLGKKSITALIGPDDSSSAVVIAGLLQVLNVSVISPTATSPELSAQTYQYLYRTAPSDAFKGKAMADLIEYFKWSYVAAVGQDDSYGRNGLWSVVREAEARNNSYCLAMTKFISYEGRILNIRNIVTTLRRYENIRVVILWLHGTYAKDFFTEVYRQNLTGRVWILSDVFISDSIPGFSSIFDGSIVVKPHRFSAETEFEERKKALTIKTINQTFPEWSSEIKTLITNCSASNENANSMEQCFHDFVQRMQSSYTPYVIDAVYSMAHALNVLFENATVKDIDYKLKRTMDINVKKGLLSRVSFVGLTGNVSFDKDGDRQSVLYDIVNFQQVEEGHTKRLEQVVVGKWKENEPHAKRLHFSQEIHWNSPTNQPPKSECLEQCPAGTRKSITSPCCWNCVACPRGTVNPIPGLETCIECPRGKKSNEARTHCVDLPRSNLKYSSPGGIAIVVFTVAVKSRSRDGMDQSFVNKENRRPFVTSQYQKRVHQNEEEDETCDEGCQSMCRLFNPDGDCSHCGCDDEQQNQAQDQKRVHQEKEEEDETCDQNCQSMCRLFNPDGDCSHCGCDDEQQNQAQEQKRVRQDKEEEEDETCDEGCQSMCRLLNPDGDCSHCGCDDEQQNQAQDQKRVHQEKEEEDETCDQNCQSMCRLFNPDGDCSNCGCK